MSPNPKKYQRLLNPSKTIKNHCEKKYFNNFNKIKYLPII